MDTGFHRYDELVIGSPDSRVDLTSKGQIVGPSGIAANMQARYSHVQAILQLLCVTVRPK